MLSHQIARSDWELQQLTSRIQQSSLSPDAQPSTTGEEQSAEAHSGEARKTFSNHLSQLEVARTKPLSQGREGVPAYGTAVQKLQSRSLSLRLSPESERAVTSTIEQLELSQLKSPQLNELVKRLKRMYSIARPEEDNSRGESAPHPYTSFGVGESWQEIQGCSRWDGLLDPLNQVLRAEVVRYGEFAQVAYDAFDRDKTSKYCGSCKYTKETLLEKCGLDNRGYEVTQYLYATTDLDLPNFFTKSTVDDMWSKDSNWMGFVAVCTSPKEIARLGRRDIVVAWRGTITKFEWIKDIQDWLAPAGFDPRHGHKNVMVESGFLSMYKSSNSKSRYNKKSAREQVLEAVKDLVEKYKHERHTPLSITVTGHSLGSALAILCGYDISESRLNRISGTSPTVPSHWYSRKADWELASPSPNPGGSESVPALSSDHLDSSDSETSASNPGSGPAGVGSLQKPTGKFFPSDRIPITVYSFAGPRVGNRAFKNRLEQLGVAVLRVANKQDLVTKVPGKVLPTLMEFAHNFISSVIPSYRHVGVKLRIDTSVSPFLHNPENLLHAHCLEAYLHVVDGFHGRKLPFKPTIRDYALVNKGGDFLKRKFFIPAAWWQEAYKGLVRDINGHWLLPPRSDENWPPSPDQLGEKSAEAAKDEQFKEFWRSVSVAYQRSTSTSAYISLSALQASAYGSASASSRDDDVEDAANRAVVGAVNIPVNDPEGDAADRERNTARNGASDREGDAARNGASNRGANDAERSASNRGPGANDGGDSASNRAVNTAKNGDQVQGEPQASGVVGRQSPGRWYRQFGGMDGFIHRHRLAEMSRNN